MIRLIFGVLVWLLPVGLAVCQTSTELAIPGVGIADPIKPLTNSILLAGEGDLSNVSRRTFAWMAGEHQGRLLVITNDQQSLDRDPSRELNPWRDAIGTVDRLVLATRSQAESQSSIDLIEKATGVWFVDDVSEFAVGSRFHEAIHAFAARGGAIGGHGPGANSLGQWVVGRPETGPRETRPGFAIVPQSIVLSTQADAALFKKNRNSIGSENMSPKDASPQSPAACVHWMIPPGAVMVMHQGRKVAVIGEADVTAFIPAANGWPERSETFGAPIVQLPYTTDLVAWTRSAQSRSGPVFPPMIAPSIEVRSGALMLIGGGGSTDDMWTRFIEAAGGTDARFVCLPQTADSFSADKLRERGCKNVTVLFSDQELREKAESDDDFLRPLAEADGVFFGGGRTFWFMDAYQNTTAHRLMLDVLDRGGVIAGTSAGAQIQGDFLVRGDPRTNQTLWYPGNDTGLAFLRGVIVDVHFGERDRDKTFPALLAQHPQLSGIGIDEATAIVVTGYHATVLGRGSAWFYDPAAMNSDAASPLRLTAGQSYDFERRTEVKLPADQ